MCFSLAGTLLPESFSQMQKPDLGRVSKENDCSLGNSLSWRHMVLLRQKAYLALLDRVYDLPLTLQDEKV